MGIARILLWLALMVGFYALSCRLTGKYYRVQIFPEYERKIVWMGRKVLIKLIFVGMVVLMVFFTTFSLVKSLLYGLCTYGLLHASERISREHEKKAVLIDVLNVCECLRVQLSSQISLNNALKNLVQLCKNQEFKRYLTDLFLEYELSKYTVCISAGKLGKRFPYSEIKIFLSVLNQQIQGTSGLEGLDNLIVTLKEKYVEFLEEATKNKIALMIAGVFFIVMNLAAISIYPVMIESLESIQSIFS